MALQMHVEPVPDCVLERLCCRPAQLMKLTVSAICDTRMILNFIIRQFVLLHADVQMMILTAIIHAYRNTGPCIPFLSVCYRFLQIHPRLLNLLVSKCASQYTHSFTKYLPRLFTIMTASE
jgi:hypothetical protein